MTNINLKIAATKMNYNDTLGDSKLALARRQMNQTSPIFHCYYSGSAWTKHSEILGQLKNTLACSYLKGLSQQPGHKLHKFY